MKTRQKGTILITTLLLLAVVTVIAVGMAERSQIDIKRTGQLLTAQQAYLYVLPAEIWAFQKLKTLPLEITKDTPIDTWPQVMPTMDIPDGTVNAILADAQGEFYNLNNLSDINHQRGFDSLLRTLLPSQSRENTGFLINAVVSWISPTGQRTDTLSDQYYLGLNPPYRAAHQLFVSPSELRLVKGMTAQYYHALSPYLIALPETNPTPVNVNTASPMIFLSTGDGFSMNDAQAIIGFRQAKEGFRTLEDFFALPLMKNRNLSAQNYSIDSNYFLLKTLILLNHQQLTVYTLFKRTKNMAAKTNDINILWQMRGTL